MDKKEALKKIKSGDIKIADIKEFKSEKEVVLAAVKKYKNALKFADNKLKADKDVVFTAIKKSWEANSYRL